MTENDIGYKVRGACFSVHNELSPGLLESAYEEAMSYELRNQGLHVDWGNGRVLTIWRFSVLAI